MLKTILYKRSASVHHLNEALQQTKKEKKEKVEGDIKKKKELFGSIRAKRRAPDRKSVV